ncbi:C40 family peptidase [Paenibacillus sp. GCM10023248]|uniref:C40 family peptidase n=1 Tax=unclassified Paenibacillus TaxID=185978 RepID=UPI002377E1C2|nr:C40 family peptidase [Paenibacillus sp. MAHUQ-63]MDD9266686.1 NlpC/P60 family protein [Paenibacillus sp. MAHUQ-63]
MLAPKHMLSTLVIALAVLIGFTLQNPEQMTLSAAYFPSNNTDKATPPTIDDSAQPLGPSPVMEERVSAATSGHKEAVHTAMPTHLPEVPASMKAQPTALPAPTAAAPLETAASPEPSGNAPESEKAPSASSSAPPEKKPVKEYIGDGDDPVANVKKVNLPSAEIMKIKARFELLAASGEKKPDWKRKAERLIAKGMDYLGTPYVFGAKAGQTESFDCSSFLQYLFGTQEVKLPRDSRQMSQRGTEVSIGELREGDLIFFTTPKRRNRQGTERIGHVAVYIGGGLMLHTFRPGIGVTVSELDGAWKDRFIKAKRVLS